MEGARTRSKQIQFHRVATRKIVYRPRENRSIELETCIYIYRFEFQTDLKKKNKKIEEREGD